jgi:hypothetical protein
MDVEFYSVIPTAMTVIVIAMFPSFRHSNGGERSLYLLLFLVLSLHHHQDSGPQGLQRFLTRKRLVKPLI